MPVEVNGDPGDPAEIQTVLRHCFWGYKHVYIYIYIFIHIRIHPAVVIARL